MEIDWEFEVGGGAPVIDARWPGFVDLHLEPERIGEISEAAKFPPLSALLLALNADDSSLWTSKCDFWQSEVSADSLPDAVLLACYIDLLPLAGEVFHQPNEAENFCRALVACLEPVPIAYCAVELVIRSAVAGAREGFGVTAYLSAETAGQSEATQALTAAFAAFAAAAINLPAPESPASKIR
jgi:hypothetical protein